MKNRRLKSIVAGCAATFSFAALPAQAQQSADPAPTTAPTTAPAKPESKAELPKSPSDAQYEFLVRRVVRLSGGVDRNSAEQVIKQLTTLEELDPGKDVTLIINSPGGGVVQGLSIINRIQSMRSKVNTVCQGEAQSMGAVILAAGTGTRTAYEDCLIMIHQVSSAASGNLASMQNDMKQTERLNGRLLEILSAATGLSQRDLHRVMQTDFNLTPVEAKTMGIIDNVIPVIQVQHERHSKSSIPPQAERRNFPPQPGS